MFTVLFVIVGVAALIAATIWIVVLGMVISSVETHGGKCNLVGALIFSFCLTLAIIGAALTLWRLFH